MNNKVRVREEEGRGVRVLWVADDSEAALGLTAEIEAFEDRISIEKATSATEAVDRLADKAYDCVVSHCRTSETTGFDFLRTIREDWPNVPFVLVAEDGSEELAAEAIAAGVSDYIPDALTDEKHALVATRITTAVSKHRAETALETRIRQQEVLADLSQQALRGTPPSSLFAAATRSVAETLGTDLCKVLRLRPETDDLLLEAGVGWNDGVVGEQTVGTETDSQAGYTLATDEPVVVEDLRTETRFSGPDLLVNHDVVSGISVIIGSPDDPWGVLGTHTIEKRQFTDDDITFVQSVANVLGTAIDRAERERELRESERRFEAVFEDPTAVLCLLDPDRTIRMANETALDITDADRGDLEGTVLCETGYWDHDPAAREQVREQTERAGDGEFVRFETEIRIADGGTRTLDINLRPVTNDDGEVAAIIAEARDVTEREERRRELALMKRAIDEASIGVTLTDPSRPDNPVVYANEGFTRLTGYETDAIIGRNCRFLQGPETDPEPVAAMRSAIDDERPISVELRNYRRDGTEFWNQVAITPIEDEDGEVTRFLGFQHDVTARKRRETQLAALAEASGDLLAAEDADAVCDIAVETAETGLNLPLVMVARYEETDGCLRPAALTSDARRTFDTAALLAPESGPAWEAFAENRTVVRDSLPNEENEIELDESAYTVVVEPLGRHGVLVAARTRSQGDEEFPDPLAPETESAFLRLLAANAESALDRSDHERQLKESETRLRDQNERLERLNRVNDVIRRVDRTLVAAKTREEIHESVCSTLTETSPYIFAWLAEYDSFEEEMRPLERAGSEKGYLDRITPSLDDESEPTARAARTREPQIVDTILDEPPLSRWRQEAHKRGYRAVASIPLVYEESLYGVLSVYADQSGVFDDLEWSVMVELGETIAHAISAIESKEALVAGAVHEIEFVVRDPDIPLLETTDRLDCSFVLENAIWGNGEKIRLFLRMAGADPDEVAKLFERAIDVDSVTQLAEQDGEHLIECTVTESNLIAALVEHGAVPRAFTAEHGVGRITVTLPLNADVETFIDTLKQRHADANVVAHREREHSMRTRLDFLAEVEERLTDRQLETLRTAHAAGFFDTPRAVSGADVGELLGVSQPTFSSHLRAAQRKLFGLLFEEQSPAL